MDGVMFRCDHEVDGWLLRSDGQVQMSDVSFQFCCRYKIVVWLFLFVCFCSGGLFVRTYPTFARVMGQQNIRTTFISGSFFSS
jgi:hypothetical protein